NGYSIKDKILLNSLNKFVPQYGINENSIVKSIQDLKYNDSMNVLFKEKENELIYFYLKNSRVELANSIKKDEEFNALTNEDDKLKYLMKKRLLLNLKLGERILNYLILPKNISKSLDELMKLSDDFAFFSNDMSNDFAWYSKRFCIAMIYVKSELYMINDKSSGFKNTLKFLEDSIDRYSKLGYAYNETEKWAIFNGFSLINLIRSQLTR
ncbi:ubiquinone biosynthesis protein COQ9, partial [Ascoidea rubescens DSM 1968]